MANLWGSTCGSPDCMCGDKAHRNIVEGMRFGIRWRKGMRTMASLMYWAGLSGCVDREYALDGYASVRLSLSIDEYRDGFFSSDIQEGTLPPGLEWSKW